MMRLGTETSNHAQGRDGAPAIVCRPIGGECEASHREIKVMVPVVGIEPTLPKGNGILNDLIVKNSMYNMLIII